MLTVTNLNNEQIPVWTLDFETYYDTAINYSLRKMTSIEYIRSPLFKAHGVAVVDPNEKTYWVTHNELKKFFSSIAWDKIAVLGHNSSFDFFIISEIYGYHPSYILDTMSMSRGFWGPGVSASLQAACERAGLKGKIKGSLEKTDGIRDLSAEQEEALIPYAIQDAEQTRLLFEHMYYDGGYPEQELHIIDMTMRMFTRPLLNIHPGLCEAEIEEEDLRMQKLLSSDLIGSAELSANCAAKLQTEGLDALMRSRPCFAELLQSRGIAPPIKEVKKKGVVVEGKYTYAFAKNDIELINLADDPRVSDLIAVWTGLKSTIRKTRAEKFLAVTEHGAKPLPVPLAYCGGRTHRWSGEIFNMQNLASGRDGRSTRLREAVQAPPGYMLIKADSAQCELRFLAWLAGEDELLDDLKNERDPYSKLASEIFGVPVSKTQNKEFRFVGKEGELSLGFGVGWPKFFNTIQTKYGLDVNQFSEEDAMRTVDMYREKRTGVIALWREMQKFLHLMAAGEANFPYKVFRFANDKIMMPNELFIFYNNLHWLYDKETERGNYVYEFRKDYTTIYAAKVVENIVQSGTRSIIAEQALNISRRYPVVNLIHDEIHCLAKEEEAEEALQFMADCMLVAPSWCADLPLGVDKKYGKNYAQV